MNQNRTFRSWLVRVAGLLLVPAVLEAQPTYTRISGGALDSISMRPLSGALVQLVSPDNPARSRTATADERGSWAIDSVPLGSYLLGFLHPVLDSISVPPPLIRVDAVTSTEIRVMLTTPSSRTLVAQTCGAGVASDSLGLFRGRVRSARGHQLTAPARIRSQWLEITLGAGGIERRRPSQLVNADSTGVFNLCGIPADGTFLVRAFAGSDSSGFVEFDAPRNGLLVRDIFVGAAQKEPAPAGSVTNEPLLRGTGALNGVVRSRTGEPVRGARLVLWGSGLEDTTETNGQYALQRLPSGSYTLEARALGFLPAKTTIDVPEGNTLATDLVLEAFVPVLDTMRIRADRIAALNQLSEFERRRKAGGGYFVDEAQMARRSPMFMSDLLRTIPGVSIVGSSDRRDRIRMRGIAGNGSCIPSVYLNGMRAPVDDGDVEALVNPQTVRAVEVYTRTGNIPFELQVPNGCGVVVIWTGARSQIPSR